MKRADLLRLHRAHCSGCDGCESRAEARKEAAEEPYDDNGGRADTYERYFDGPVGI